VYIGDLRPIVFIIIKQFNQAFAHALNHRYLLFRHYHNQTHGVDPTLSPASNPLTQWMPRTMPETMSGNTDSSSDINDAPYDEYAPNMVGHDGFNDMVTPYY
jgi:hypothetical protein